MCGLAGVARTDGTALEESAGMLLGRMAAAVAHRGPDDQELLRRGPVGLGFVRLSLVDPAGGGQPLSSADGTVVLIANGEIYNHRELAAEFPAGTIRSGSDCEILIHLYRRYGNRFLDRVRGIFAFVLWDEPAQKLIFARDRFGIKPLYYHRNRERIVFASEIKALFEAPGCPREVDWEGSLADQMMSAATGFSEEPVSTWFKDIELVPAATIVTTDLRDGRQTSHRYWELPRYTGDGAGSEQDLISSYRDALISSVTDSEMADVGIGLFLSGGIDSAAIASLTSIKPPTYTALNGSTLANGDAEYGHRIAQSLGLENHQVLFDTKHTPSAEEWRQFVWLMETPLCGPEAYYKYELYRYVRRATPDVKAMLLGGGSDEFNGGYTVSISGEGEWNDLLNNLGSMELKRGMYRNPALGAWWELPGRPLLNDSVLGRGVPGGTADPYETMFRWKYRDIQQYNCWHEDRSAAGNGIEARVPFLDHRLIEIVAAVPRALRQRLVWDKRILREAMRGIVPEYVINRPKVPFFYGDGVDHTYRTFARMVAQDGGALIDEAFSGPVAREFVNVDNVRQTVSTLLHNPASGHVEFLLRVLNLGLLEQMTRALPAPLVSAVKAEVPASITIRQWDQTAVEDAVHIGRRPPIDGLAVVGLPEDVLLLHSADRPAVWYLVVDGSIEYVIDEDENPQWIRLLQAIDDVQPLEQILAGLDIELDSVRELLTEAVELGVVSARAGSAAPPASVAEPC